MASHNAYLPLVSSPVARKRYTSPTTATVRPCWGTRMVGFIRVVSFRSGPSWPVREIEHADMYSWPAGAAPGSSGEYFIGMGRTHHTTREPTVAEGAGHDKKRQGAGDPVPLSPRHRRPV